MARDIFTAARALTIAAALAASPAFANPDTATDIGTAPELSCGTPWPDVTDLGATPGAVSLGQNAFAQRHDAPEGCDDETLRIHAGERLGSFVGTIRRGLDRVGDGFVAADT